MAPKKYWMPSPLWTDQSCYIIGGGPSLKEFDWNVLRDKNVIGCNAAFYLGVDIVPYTIFGDGVFLKQHRTGLNKYSEEGGIVITNSRLVDRLDIPEYLKVMKKIEKGMIKDGLGWNANTGAAAINLALLFGASPIYLLGYDMQLSPEGKKNFHDAYSDQAKTEVYSRFLKGMFAVAKDLRDKFPGKEVINLEDDTSALKVFPKQSLKEHFSKELV